jgi:uncharacterized small protein (DUF1192 family)
MPEESNRPLEGRERHVETDLEALRVTVASMEREIGILRADLERLRIETERAAGSRLP